MTSAAAVTVAAGVACSSACRWRLPSKQKRTIQSSGLTLNPTQLCTCTRSCRFPMFPAHVTDICMCIFTNNATGGGGGGLHKGPLVRSNFKL